MPFAAYVAEVDSAELRQNSGQFDDLVRIAVGAWGKDQPG